MASFSGLVIGLSLVFGCILLAFVAVLYYLLWWKKKRVSHSQSEDDLRTHSKDLTHLFCWRNPSSLQPNSSSNSNGDAVKDPGAHELDLDPELGSSKDLLLRALGEGVEAELMRLHNLAGPPRFLFTINEETKEDLESDDGKSRGDRSRKGSRTESLSDIKLTTETPFLSPLASSPAKSSTLNLDSYHHHGFNPLFELDFNRMRSSPPPKFKFLRDAEEKLTRKLKEEESHGRVDTKICGSFQDYGLKAAAADSSTKEKGEMIEGSFLKFIVGKTREPLQYLPQYPSSCSQILPLASSPRTFRPLDKVDGLHY